MKQLDQYPIDREEFTNIFCSVFNPDNICDIIFSGYEGYSYKCWIYDDEVYILNKETGDFINWYKIDHIGRCLTSTIGSKPSDYVKFFTGLADEMCENGVIHNEQEET